MMGRIGIWITGALFGLVGLVGLFMASGAQDDMFYFSGLVMFVFSILLIFRLISKYGPQ